MNKMATLSSSPAETRATRAKSLSDRGAFYNGIGVSLIVGLLIVVGLGVLGVTSGGWFSVTTAMAMIGLSIGLLAVVSLISLISMSRTIKILGSHEAVLAMQADKHAALAAQVQSQRAAAQAARDRGQDAALADLSDRQDASFVEATQRAEGGRTMVHAREGRTGRGDPFQVEGAEIHPVQDVEGIGKHYGELLEEIGIMNTRDLWYADPVSVAGSIEADLLRVKDWQSMSELMTLDGVGPQYSELLVRAGVASIPALCAEDPEELEGRIQALEGRLQKRVQGNKIGTKVVKSWIATAWSHHNGGPQKITADSGGS